MDLNLLVTLKVLLEEVNVTRAGRRLGLKQPAMSWGLAKLRRRFDDELLIKQGRDYVLTPFAKSLLPRVQETVQLLSEALEVDERFDAATSTRQFRLMMTDYGVAILHGPLRRRLRQLAPGVRVRVDPLRGGVHESDRFLVDYDAVVAPLGYNFPGRSQILWRDRLVLLVDPGNPRLIDGRLTLGDVQDMHHVTASFGAHISTPASRFLEEHDLRRRIKVVVDGWLPIPSVIENTDLVALIPESRPSARATARTAHRGGAALPAISMVVSCWFGEHRLADGGNRWLLARLSEVASELSTADERAGAE